jgi:WD40 repeat protein
VLTSDGGAEFLPQAFSYGPAIVEVTPNASTAEGGGTAVVFGFGFGSVTGNDQIPQGLQVTAGGQQVQIAAFNANGYSYGSAPTPLESLSFTIPPGTAGATSTISVTTQSGTATLSGGMQYLPAVQQVAVSGAASLAQGIYDPTRNVYYFTDASEIRVYSRSGNQWLTPIQVPAAPAGATHRLWGIALSPNGNNLAVADASAGMIYLLNPDSPGSVQSFVFNQAYVGGSPVPNNGAITNPAGIVVSDSGMIYLAAFTVGGTGFDAFFKLDPSSAQVTDYRLMDCAMAPLYKLAVSSDNSLVFLNDGGIVASIHTASDELTVAGAEPGGCYGDYDLTLSSGQATVEASSYLYDENLNGESYLVLSDRDSSNISYVYGTQLSADGTLLFQPSTNGIDVYDGRLGILLTRIALPVALSQNYDALVADGEDNVLIAITGTSGSGIAVVDLASLVEPPALPYSHSVFMTGNERSTRNGGPSALRSSGMTLKTNKVPRLKVPHVTNGILR